MQLSKNKPLYLNGHSSKIVDSTVLKSITRYVQNLNFVPGFLDVLVVTNKKRLSTVRKLKPDRFQLHAGTVTSLPKVAPDIVWVDDVNLLASDIKRLAIKYSGVPHIYSGCKPNGKPSIIADTREQCPVYKGVECKRMTLVVGDYTTDKLYNKFHIERKSLQDLYGSIIQGHQRFSNELIRAKVYGIELVIFVEGTRKDFINKKFPRGDQRKVEGKTLDKIISSMERRYGIQFVWCTSRRNMKQTILTRFKKEEKKYAR